MLDQAFQALADPTRRAVVDRLCDGPASVSELARPFTMTLAAVVQHVQVLEAAGLVTSQKIGRVRTVQVDPGGLRAAEDWLAARRTGAERGLDRLTALLTDHPLAATTVPRTKQKTKQR